jgi:hypothetical protein
MEVIEDNQFDIVIPIGPNDINVCRNQIKYTKLNVIGYRNIYLISVDPTFKSNNCITINENIFPFSKEDIVKYHGNTTRQGWYLQQLIKLYAGIVIPGILDKYLVIDADTFFLKPTRFIENDKCLFNISNAYHKPYFEHMFKLHNSLEKQIENVSGICHHMIFDTNCIKQLFELVENEYNDVFWNVFLQSVHIKDYEYSGASEYELYFNYMLKYHRDKMEIRPLNWKEISNIAEIYSYSDFDYVTCHWYWR